MTDSENTELGLFLEKAPWPALREELPTFFSIANIGHKELPLSNVYAFFFQSEEPHGLGTLFVDALLDVVRAKRPGLVKDWPKLDGPVRVAREYVVDNQQRLDLLVHDGPANATLEGARFAILIENKVNHWLANDLGNYMGSVRRAAPRLGGELGVVLGPRREYPVEPWVFVSHWELAQAVAVRLQPLEAQANTRYLPVLQHLLEHLTLMSDYNDNFAQAFGFVQAHRQQLAKAQQVIGAFKWQSLSTAVVDAFGDGYEKQVEFSDRVDIRLSAAAPLRYIVFFAHILNLEKEPGFAITLYADGCDRQQVAAWREFLKSQDANAEPLPWFARSYQELVIGRRYPVRGFSLEEFQKQVHEALQQDWKPLEEVWRTLIAPPTVTSEA